MAPENRPSQPDALSASVNHAATRTPVHRGFHEFTDRPSTYRPWPDRGTCCSGCDTFASVPNGHEPFAVFNRTANPVVRAVLSSPLHPLLSRNLALITITVAMRSENDPRLSAAPEWRPWCQNICRDLRAYLISR